MRKKHKMANISRSLPKKKNFSPVLKSPTHIGFIDVKKNGSKISHLGTFKGHTPVVAAGAAAVAGTMAAGQLASVLAGTAAGQVNSGGRAEVPPSSVPPDRCNDPGLSCQVHVVSLE